MSAPTLLIYLRSFRRTVRHLLVLTQLHLYTIVLRADVCSILLLYCFPFFFSIRLLYYSSFLIPGTYCMRDQTIVHSVLVTQQWNDTGRSLHFSFVCIAGSIIIGCYSSDALVVGWLSQLAGKSILSDGNVYLTCNTYNEAHDMTSTNVVGAQRAARRLSKNKILNFIYVAALRAAQESNRTRRVGTKFSGRKIWT